MTRFKIDITTIEDILQEEEIVTKGFQGLPAFFMTIAGTLVAVGIYLSIR